MLPVAGSPQFLLLKMGKDKTTGWCFEQRRKAAAGEHEPYEVGRDVTGDVISGIL
jgi:hypothetical protein